MVKLQLIQSQLKQAIEQRAALNDLPAVYRLFNGFYEGNPGLTLDRYGTGLVISDHNEPEGDLEDFKEIASFVLERVEGLQTALLKQRQHADEARKNGFLLMGDSLPDEIQEFGLTYALDLQMNQDASFYLDTRNLRRWLLDHSEGLDVLNTFAYTGSLGVGAGAGGAQRVIQTDLNSRFLAVGRRSWELNGLPTDGCEYIPGDFFRVMGRLRHADRLFGCVILDPPYFSITDAGQVDLQNQTTRLINKVRPLVAHEGWLVVVNNALFLSGKDFSAELESLCQSPYLSFEGMIDVPQDVIGYPETITDPPPVDPAPFNHPTKIAILRAYRRDARQA